MTKTTTKTKGNRYEKARFHIPFYSKAFFDPDDDKSEDGEGVKAKKESSVKIPIKIREDGDEQRGNMTAIEMKAITHFDDNVENVLESFVQLYDRIVKPKGIEDKDEEFKVVVQLLHIVCRGPADQTLQEALKVARTNVFDKYISEYEQDELMIEILKEDEKIFYECISKEWQPDELGDFASSEELNAFLHLEYKRNFWNYLHTVIFGADSYRSIKQQKDYMCHKIVKPFGISVEAAFRRIEIVASLMQYFPPPSNRGSTATREQWEKHEKNKKIKRVDKREWKYNLLPESFHDRFEELEKDWTEMSDSKFLAEAQKCAAMDAKDRLKQVAARDKLKRKKEGEDDSKSNLNGNQKATNSKSKKAKTGTKATYQGQARLCELCKMAGAPEHVFKTHYTNQCNKKEQYEKALSGSAGKRQAKVKEYRRTEKELKKELKLLSKIKKLKRSKDSDSSSESSGSE